MQSNLTSKQIIDILRDDMPFLKKEYQVNSLSLFGSYAQEKQTATSDIDLLVTFDTTPGFIKFMKLENHLADKLAGKVDLVMKDSLKKNIARNVYDDAVSV